MTDNEILLALSNMLEPVKTDLQEVKGKVRKIEQTQEKMGQRLQKMDERLRKIELTQENVILPRLQTIESCYTSTYDRYKENVDEFDVIKQDVSVLKDVVTKHSEKLQKIS